MLAEKSRILGKAGLSVCFHIPLGRIEVLVFY